MDEVWADQVQADEVQAVADAVMYEGYLLYPYRRSSGKNRIRWQFGVLLPPAWTRAHGLLDAGVAGSAESWWQQTECLLEADEDEPVRARVRFLELERRPDFDGAVPREIDIEAPVGELLHGGRRVASSVPGISASVTVSASVAPAPFPLVMIRIRTENTDATVPVDCPRDHALRRALLATHTVLRVRRGRFLSLLDPPQWAAEAARRCHNVHTFPVLAGPPGRTDVMLSAPIILPDYPRVAPESPGDLHDATEIDEILSLRTLTLTDEEKREARATDPRGAAILDRVEMMPPEVLEKLHGAIRSLRPASQPERASADSLVVNGVSLSTGSRVLLRPRRRGTDAHDMFLEGRLGRVEEILRDVDGTSFLAVTVDDDPGAELHQWYGRLRHFRPDEVEPVAEAPVAGAEAVAS